MIIDPEKFNPEQVAADVVALLPDRWEDFTDGDKIVLRELLLDLLEVHGQAIQDSADVLRRSESRLDAGAPVPELDGIYRRQLRTDRALDALNEYGRRTGVPWTRHGWPTAMIEEPDGKVRPVET